MSDNMPERVTLSELPKTSGKGRPASQKYITLAEWMTEEPGVWFKITEGKHGSYATVFKNGEVKAFPKGEFQFATRKDEATGMIVTWGRKPVEG